MSTEVIKDFLFEKTGISQINWKRISKKSSPQGSVRVFQNKLDNSEVWTLESKNGQLSIIAEMKTENTSNDLVRQAKNLVRNYYHLKLMH